MAGKQQKFAKEDITAKNELGQTVVLVPKGQPIPDDFNEEEYAARTVAVRNADDETVDEARGIKRAESKKAADTSENK